MAQTTAQPEIRAYWQPGCTSCLRMKEFLTRHGVPFVSVNVLEDKRAFEELAKLGVRSVPIVQRGTDWANGQVLRDVARVAGIAFGGTNMLTPEEMIARLNTIQSAAQRFLTQIPDDKLATLLPNRPRSYAELVYHIFNIADAFLEHEVQGLPLKEGAYSRVPPPEMDTKAKILAYGVNVQQRLNAWWAEHGAAADFNAKARVYYGDQTLHDFLERTTWHSGQHVRQLMMVLGLLGLTPDKPVSPETWKDLPMPEKVWDDEKFAA
jgi:glutaredoxin